MRRLIAIAVAVGMSLSLVSCGSTSQDNTTTTDAGSVQSNSTPESPQTNDESAGATAAANDLELMYCTEGGDFSLHAEGSAINSFVDAPVYSCFRYMLCDSSNGVMAVVEVTKLEDDYQAVYSDFQAGFDVDGKANIQNTGGLLITIDGLVVDIASVETITAFISIDDNEEYITDFAMGDLEKFTLATDTGDDQSDAPDTDEPAEDVNPYADAPELSLNRDGDMLTILLTGDILSKMSNAVTEYGADDPDLYANVRFIGDDGLLGMVYLQYVDEDMWRVDYVDSTKASRIEDCGEYTLTDDYLTISFNGAEHIENIENINRMDCLLDVFFDSGMGLGLYSILEGEINVGG